MHSYELDINMVTRDKFSLATNFKHQTETKYAAEHKTTRKHHKNRWKLIGDTNYDCQRANRQPTTDNHREKSLHVFIIINFFCTIWNDKDNDKELQNLIF